MRGIVLRHSRSAQASGVIQRCMPAAVSYQRSHGSSCVFYRLHALWVMLFQQSLTQQAKPAIKMGLTFARAQVLRSLRGEATHDVFGVLSQEGVASGARQAMSLPQDLLAKWVEAQGPVLDLQHARLSLVQWARLSCSMHMVQPDAITTLHLSAASTSVPAQGENFGRVMSALQKSPDYNTAVAWLCCKCGNGQLGRLNHAVLGFLWPSLGHFVPSPCQQLFDASGSVTFEKYLSGLQDTLSSSETVYCSGCNNSVGIHAPTTVALGFKCSSCTDGVRANPSPPKIFDIDDLATPEPSEYNREVLCMMGGMLQRLKGLQHLGLHNLPLQSWLGCALGQVFADMPDTLTCLTLSTSINKSTSDSTGSAAVQGFERAMVFKAVAHLKRLKELHMPEWEAFVGCAPSCCAPLRAVPGLTIYVSEVKNSPAFPHYLKFSAIKK
jgi:hypothetical protein